MHFDIFFSISQAPVDGHLPSEAEMFHNFFDQVRAADELGFGVAWLAESHLSTHVQKSHPKPVVPHWEGEIGLNVDLMQLATRVFSVTRRIEVGSAIMNLLVNGGPIAAAERLAYFLTLHGLNPEETRRLRLGFAQGRFEFMNRASGIVPRSAIEERIWKPLRSKIFAEACEIFLRLYRGEVLNSSMIAPPKLTANDFSDSAEWQSLVDEGLVDPQSKSLRLQNRWNFLDLKIIPEHYRRDLCHLYLGSHDGQLQMSVNRICPVRVFNLSITNPQVIDQTHERMERAFHPNGGPWKREYMPRTVMVFINEEENLTQAERQRQAKHESEKALRAYWQALEGTVDPEKVAKAADNAVIGDASQVAQQIRERFHPGDRLMLWFDFFNHDSQRVKRNMQAFMDKVVPTIEGSA